MKVKIQVNAIGKLCSLDLSIALYSHGVPIVLFVGVTVVLENSEVFKK